MSFPKASVLIITYNQESIIHKTIDSILVQKCDFDYEIVIGDDCSKDKTGKILDEYRDKYPNKIRVIHNEKNLGIVKNYINVIKQCNGEYIAECAGDDYWIDGRKLQKQVDIMEKRPEIGMVYTDHKMLFTLTGEESIHRSPKPAKNTFTQLLHGNIIKALTVCFRANLLQYVDYDYIKDLCMEDYPMWLEFSVHTKFYHLPEITTVYTLAREEVLDPKIAVISMREFGVKTHAIAMHYIEKYPDKTELTAEELDDEFYSRYAYAGILSKERKVVLENIRKIKHPTRQQKMMFLLFHSRIAFEVYMLYRRKTVKEVSQVDAYFS